MAKGVRAFFACLSMIVLTGGTGTAGVLVNGGFETGDFSGWTLAEGEPPEYGTWGIAQAGQTIAPGDYVYDFCDKITIEQHSSGLPKTYQPAEGVFMALQLQLGGQEHRMFQDVDLPANGSAVSWDMFFDNKAGFFAPDQYMAVHIRDMNDNVLETLFATDERYAQQIPMTNFIFDISSYAGTRIRLDVELKVHQNFFDAGFDNFRIHLVESGGNGDAGSGDDLGTGSSPTAPPGWSKSKGKKFGWAHRKTEPSPKGFNQGLKKGWSK